MGIRRAGWGRGSEAALKGAPPVCLLLRTRGVPWLSPASCDSEDSEGWPLGSLPVLRNTQLTATEKREHSPNAEEKLPTEEKHTTGSPSPSAGRQCSLQPHCFGLRPSFISSDNSKEHSVVNNVDSGAGRPRFEIPALLLLLSLPPLMSRVTLGK